MLWLSKEGGGAKANQNEKFYGKEEWNKMCKKAQLKEITWDGKDRKKEPREEKVVKMDRERHYFKNWIEYTIRFPHFLILAQVFLANYSSKHMSSFNIRLGVQWKHEGDLNDYANTSITSVPACHTVQNTLFLHTVAGNKFNKYGLFSQIS